MQFVKNLKLKFALIAAMLLAVVQGSYASGSPVSAVVDAIEGVQADATTVIAAGGGIIVALAIVGGLWIMGKRWAGRAARGG